MRTQDEIQRMHDLIVGALIDVPKGVLPEDIKKGLNLQACVLCWVLQHDHNTEFEDAIQLLERALMQCGYSLAIKRPEAKHVTWHPGRLPRGVPIVGAPHSPERQDVAKEILRPLMDENKVPPTERVELEATYLALPK